MIFLYLTQYISQTFLTRCVIQEWPFGVLAIQFTDKLRCSKLITGSFTVINDVPKLEHTNPYLILNRLVLDRLGSFGTVVLKPEDTQPLLWLSDWSIVKPTPVQLSCWQVTKSAEWLKKSKCLEHINLSSLSLLSFCCSYSLALGKTQ